MSQIYNEIDSLEKQLRDDIYRETVVLHFKVFETKTPFCFSKVHFIPNKEVYIGIHCNCTPEQKGETKNM
jgi:hypothetical protein